MQRIANLMLKRFAQDTRGAVLIEFAYCLPVMLLLYTGGVCLSDMLACSRKLTVASRSLADLVSRTMSPTIIYNDPSTATARSYLSASGIVLTPYKLNKATEQISLLRICDASHAYVAWAQAQTQNVDGSVITPTTPDQTPGTLPTAGTQTTANIVSIPSSMINAAMVPVSPDGSNVCQNLAPGTSTKTQAGTAGGWLYRSKITYNFTPVVSFVPITTTAMTHTIYMTPRLY